MYWLLQNIISRVIRVGESPDTKSYIYLNELYSKTYSKINNSKTLLQLHMAKKAIDRLDEVTDTIYGSPRWALHRNRNLKILWLKKYSHLKKL